MAISLPKCPHCNCLLDPSPKRKKKCLSCGEYICVRQDPYDRSKIHYVNEDTALCLDMLRDLQISEKSYTDARNNAPDNRSLGDIIWSLVTTKKKAAAERSDWDTIADIAYSQSKYYRFAGKDYFPLLQESVAARLRAAMKTGVTHVQIITSRDDRVCEKCKVLDGKEYTLKEALEIMPLPVACDDDWCRCVYSYKMKSKRRR